MALVVLITLIIFIIVQGTQTIVIPPYLTQEFENSQDFHDIQEIKSLKTQFYTIEYKYNFIEIISKSGEYIILTEPPRIEFLDDSLFVFRTKRGKIVVFQSGIIVSSEPINTVVSGEDIISRLNQYFILSPNLNILKEKNFLKSLRQLGINL